MQVRAILADKGREVASADPQTPLVNIMEMLADKNIGAIVITNPDAGVEGIISERDIVRALARTGASAIDQPVASFMTTSVVTCDESATIDELMSKMTAGRFRHLPVVHAGRLSGIISIGDVVKMRIAEVQREAEALRDYIASN